MPCCQRIELLSRGNIEKGKGTRALYKELTRSNGIYQERRKKEKKKMIHDTVVPPWLIEIYFKLNNPWFPGFSS